MAKVAQDTSAEIDGADAAPNPVSPPGPARKVLRIHDLAKPQSPTDAMVASIADQLCAIVDDNYDIRVQLSDANGTESLQVQKLTVLINSLLENVRRSIGRLSDLAEGLESKVQERTLKLDLIVQSSKDGVWLWDLHDDRVEYSPRWRQILGLGQDSLSSIEDWLQRVHPDDQERLRAAIRAHLRGSALHLREDYRIRHADGTYRWVWCRGLCHRDENGRPVMMAGTQTDVHQLRSLDGSTGLPNEETLTAMLNTLIQQETEFRALVIGFPRVVSMKEEMTSDELSALRKAIACRLSAALPFSADLAHLSGDFYAALVPGQHSDAALEGDVIAPILAAFTQPFATERRAVWLDVAVGATLPIEQANWTASDVMRDAWTSYRFARKAELPANILHETQVEAARDRAYMQNEVRRGLERGWFVPFFQPIVDISTRQTLGFETLCRMNHPDLGLVSPGRFLPVAEELGVMDDIGDRMLAAALEQLGEWAADGAGFDHLFLTVNLEAQQMMEPDFPKHLKAALADRKVTPANLKLEIVESSVVGNFKVAAQQIARVREIGVKIALDDFGTGYSSLEYLNQLSFDLIKIDKAFVDDMEFEPRKTSMVKMICVLAETLGAQVCVEGIETDAQCDIVAGMNVAFGQGFLFSKPVPRDALSDTLSV
ncbi:MAG: EAL domain-containing protein [Pseudomonadota bacterium]